MAWTYGKQVWDRLMLTINNEYGVAAIMGNLDAESNIIPYRKQGDFTPNLLPSIQYTNNVDQHVISESSFVTDSVGYGLAQWTIAERKQPLFNYCKRRGTVVSIGNCDRQVDFLLHELTTSYPTVYNGCLNATDIRTPSDLFLHQFENPREQGPEVEAYREQLGIAIYTEYHGSRPRSKRKLPIYFYLRTQQ